MIFDFYENFSTLYPLKRDDLLCPDREKFGYYWDFEDFLVENEGGKGLVLQGFMITSEPDLDNFTGMFDRAFLMISIGSLIKSLPHKRDFMAWDESLNELWMKNSIVEIKKDFASRIDSREEFFSSLKSSLKEGKFWIATTSYWSVLVQRDIEGFWGNGIEIKTLPDVFSIMSRKDVWEEVDLLEPLNFQQEMAWEDLSFFHPHLVKYIDEEIRQKSGVDFLDQCHDFGLI